jgi:hypothetical protein
MRYARATSMPTDYFQARDGEGGVVGDARHFPVLIATWFGEPTERLVRRYFAWSDEVASEAYERRERYVIIADNTKARRPQPQTRALIATLIDAGPAAKTDRIVESFAVFDSALVRGAVTAMQWLSKKDWNLTTTATVQQAITAALAVLAKHGLRRPPGLSAERYVAPSRPDGPFV